MAKQAQYCSFCGGALEQKYIDDKMRDHCPHCKSVFYKNPLPVASSIVVNDKREVLLVKRKKDPYKDMWCLPIGFAESDEKVEEAALRELKEEAGIDGELVQLIDVDTVDNYFYGSLAIVTYEVRYSAGRVRAGDDAADAGYFPIYEIPPLAWSSNERALDKYIKLHEAGWVFDDFLKKMLPDEQTADRKKIDLMPGLIISIIRDKAVIIEEKWIAEIEKSVAGLLNNHAFLYQLHRELITYIGDNLEGSGFKPGNFMLEDLPDSKSISAAVILHRKNLWQQVMDKTLITTPVDALEALELNNRIVSLYDRALFNLL